MDKHSKMNEFKKPDFSYELPLDSPEYDYFEQPISLYKEELNPYKKVIQYFTPKPKKKS